MDKPKEVLVSSNHLMMLEKIGPARSEDGMVFQDFAHASGDSKAEPTRQGRIAPVRSIGESENRIMALAAGGLIKPVSLAQALQPRGHAKDLDATIFSRINPGRLLEKSEARQHVMDAASAFTGRAPTPTPVVESTSASKALVQKPLKAKEYANRKAQLIDTEAEQGVWVPNSFNGQLTRPITEVITELKATQPEGWEQQVDELHAHIEEAKKFATPPIVHNLAQIELKRLNEDRLTPEEHTFYIEQIMLKRHAMFPEAEGYDQFQDPMRHQKGKVAFLDIQVECLLTNKTPGWAADIVELRKQQAELMREIEGLPPVEPPAPPPVVDFSTEDLEQPERFIIKDLDGFKFDPETKFDGLRLPYESCLFVLGEEPLRAVVLATQEDEDVISLKLLSEQKAELPWHSTATLYVRLNGTRARLKWAKGDRVLDKRLGMVSSVLAFLAGEQIGDVEINTVVNAPMGREIPPPKPGFSYNVVSIVHEKRKALRRDWQGGTHASPREHKRKGYWWPSPKGGFLWRPAVIVNKGVLGRVEKEYHVSKRETGNDA